MRSTTSREATSECDETEPVVKPARYVGGRGLHARQLPAQSDPDGESSRADPCDCLESSERNPEFLG